MAELFVDEPPPITDLIELQEQQNCSSIFAQSFELENEKLWEGGGADPSTAWRQLLQTKCSSAQTTLLVSRDLTFREVPLDGSTVCGDVTLPAAPIDFCRVDSVAPTAASGNGDGCTLEPAEWLTVAPGLSGGLELPPPVGPAGDPGPEAADLLTPPVGDPGPAAADLLTPPVGDPGPAAADLLTPPVGDPGPAAADLLTPPVGDPGPAAADLLTPPVGDPGPAAADLLTPPVGDPGSAAADLLIPPVGLAGDPEPAAADLLTPPAGDPKPAAADLLTPSAGDPGPAAADLLTPPVGDPGPAAADLLTPLICGETWTAEPPGDRAPTPPPADDETMDHLLQEAEPYWPEQDTSAAGQDHRPDYADGWARRPDPADTLPEGLPDKDVMTFDFELDPFQKQAVGLMEQGENILVVAHTSAGKTAIAEYAIARALKDDQRVIYTSPVKALSNQKYGELRGQFEKVGLLTGDTQLNPEAPCLICTTEIMRSMLYNRPWLTEGLRTVVLDEVHYIGDQERGHIWEECLILLPRRVNLVMLSATVPNAMDIAAWVGGIKRRPVFVVSCDRRPVPLEHHLYTGPADGLWDSNLKARRTFCVLDHNGVFSEESYQLAFDTVCPRRTDRRRSGTDMAPDAVAAAANPAAGHHQNPRRRNWPDRQPSRLERQPSRQERQPSRQERHPSRPERHPSRQERHPSRPERHPSRGGVDGGHAPLARRWSVAPPTKQHWTDLVRYLESCHLLPAIVFVFSRKRCDSTATALCHLDLTTPGEKQRIRGQLRELETHLSPTDRALATVCEMKDCLLRGLGVHHAGMLPFLKETVELLYQAGLVKVLFATETFAIGINMPTRTVVFGSMSKWDGSSERRPLLPAEYIQMSGRAGRRGKDSSGTVIIMAVPRCPNKKELQSVISAAPDPIRSHFRLTFFMLLNMLSIGRDAADVVWSSFALWGRQSPRHLQQRLDRLRDNEEGARLSAEDAALLYSQCEELVKLTRQDREERSGKLAKRGNPAPGQVLLVSSDTVCRQLAVVIKVDAWRRAQHTVLALRGPPDHEPTPEAAGNGPSPEPAGDGPSPEPAGGSAAGRDRDLAGHAAAALRPSLLRPSAGAAAGAAGQVAPHQLLTVRWADVEAMLADHVTGDLSAVADNVRLRDTPDRADWKPSSTCADAVRRLAALSDGFPAGCAVQEPLPEPPRLLEVRRLLQERYPDTEEAPLVHVLEVAFEAGRLHRELQELAHWSDETTAMVRVLQELSFVDTNGQVTPKGLAACGVGYRQLLVTDLVCEGALSDLTPAELAALLSTVSHSVPMSVSLTQQDPDTSRLSAALTRGVQRLLVVARRIDAAQEKAGLLTRTDEEHSLLFDLVPAVLGWANGDELSQSEQRDQGNLCRSLQRLDETLRDVRDLAVTLDFPRLQSCVREALVAIRRGLPFSPSIYTIGPQR